MALVALALVLGCNSNKASRPEGSGLIGTYFGNTDFTNIKYPERLHSLQNKWDEHTGHGRAWSGIWQGMVVVPASGRVEITLFCNKKARMKIAGQTVSASAKTPSGSVTLAVQAGEAYPIEMAYQHTDGAPGEIRVTWQWPAEAPVAIPDDALYFTPEQGEQFNWVSEPRPEDIDRSKFLTVPARHVIVYDESGRFAGWPANNGIWSWGDEILVGFVSAAYQKKELHHSVDETQPALNLLSRSIDGGETWVTEDPEPFVGDGDPVLPRTGDIDFGHPDFAMRCNGPRFYISYDRGKTWQGPHELPDFGRKKLTSRTDYLITGPRSCLFFLSTEEDSVQARMQDRAFCATTTDGGASFSFLAWMTESATIRSVMPSTVQISDGHLVSALRRRFDQTFSDRPRLESNWIDAYESRNSGRTWDFLSKVADTDMHKRNGNPPSLVRLSDSRLCVTYGYRAVPYGIRAKLSQDNGTTWSEEIHLRDDAATWDIGYTRSVQGSDGKIVTIYYYSTEGRPEQHIAATIWEPVSLEDNPESE